MNILLSFLYFKLSFLWQIEHPSYRITSLPSSLRWPDSHQCLTPALTYLTFSLCCPQGGFHVHNPVRVALMLANRLWRAAHIAGARLALCRYAEDPRSLGFPAKSRAKCSSSMEMRRCSLGTLRSGGPDVFPLLQSCQHPRRRFFQSNPLGSALQTTQLLLLLTKTGERRARLLISRDPMAPYHIFWVALPQAAWTSGLSPLMW